MGLSLTSTLPSVEANPVYTPFYYVLTSTLSSEPDFKYVFDLTLLNQTTGADLTDLGRYKLYPRSTGNVAYSPASILENYVSYNYVFFGSGFTSNNNSTAHFKVNFGEEYSLSGSMIFTSVTNNGGFTQYDFINIPVMQVGDTVKIDKGLKNLNLNYDGLQTVTSITGNSLTTDKAFGISYANESGECISRLTINTGLTQTGMTFNAARQYFDVDKSFATTHYAASTSSEFLTNLEGYINIGNDDVFSLSFLQKQSAVTHALVATYSGVPSGPTFLGVYLVSANTSTYQHRSFKCGTKNLAGTYATELVSGNFEQIYQSGTVKYYIVTLYSNSTPVMEARTFKIDDRCGPNYARLIWLNSLGGWSFMNFNMKQREKYELDRTFANKVLPYDYELGDFTLLTTSIDVKQTITLNSFEFMTDDEFEHLFTLFTSPFILYCGSDNLTIPFVITSKEFIKKSVANDKSRQLKIEGRFAYDYILQRN